MGVSQLRWRAIRGSGAASVGPWSAALTESDDTPVEIERYEETP
jgi:hypothetical protein